ncbi:MAG TPA: EscU/YscU/HrcU family type III secretion system export apparatus switch protein [Spirochaetia bacterium]|nr:EscU/YscU/HrcU family type III secretion system export apparatus switch protein [Spirochaetia bacterium]
MTGPDAWDTPRQTGTPNGYSRTGHEDRAVAIHYSEELPAPIVVASGRGRMAQIIVDIARESGVTLVADPELADALIPLDINTVIPESLYEVIAALLVFVRGLKARR